MDILFVTCTYRKNPNRNRSSSNRNVLFLTEIVHSFCLPSAEMNLNRIRFTLVEVVKLQEETLYPILFYTIEYFFARSLIARLQSYRLYHFCCVYTILSGLSISAENGTISLSIVPLVHCCVKGANGMFHTERCF